METHHMRRSEPHTNLCKALVLLVEAGLSVARFFFGNMPPVAEARESPADLSPATGWGLG